MMELLTTPSGSVVISDRRVHDCGSRSIRYDCENSTPCRQFLAGMSTTVAPRKRPLSGVGLIDRNASVWCIRRRGGDRHEKAFASRQDPASRGHWQSGSYVILTAVRLRKATLGCGATTGPCGSGLRVGDRLLSGSEIPNDRFSGGEFVARMDSTRPWPSSVKPRLSPPTHSGRLWAG